MYRDGNNMDSPLELSDCLSNVNSLGFCWRSERVGLPGCNCFVEASKSTTLSNDKFQPLPLSLFPASPLFY